MRSSSETTHAIFPLALWPMEFADLKNMIGVNIMVEAPLSLFVLKKKFFKLFYLTREVS